MKNKRLIWTLVFLAILTLGSIGTDLFKKEQQSTHKVAKVGILQFVTHDALDQIEKGIEDGLKEAGYKGDKVQITLLNAEGDQSKIQTMSKQLVNDKNDVVIGIATPAAQGLAAATKDIPDVYKRQQEINQDNFQNQKWIMKGVFVYSYRKRGPFGN